MTCFYYQKNINLIINYNLPIMIKNYYEILDLVRGCTNQQIVQNYRRLGSRWNPKTTKENQLVARNQFNDISEAFEVLSDPIKKSFYDKYGYEKLKEGLFSEGQLQGGYHFGNNADEIYQNFYKNKDNLSKQLNITIQNQNSLFGHSFGGLNNQYNFVCENLIVPVYCALNQIYTGTSKIVTYERKKLNNDGKTTSIVTESKLLSIKPSYNFTTVLHFPNEGHENVHKTKSDLIFELKEIPNQRCLKRGDDLIYIYQLSLPQALRCTNISVPLLDGKIIKVGIDQIITPRTLKVVENLGFMNAEAQKRGDLLIKFDILFPKQLNQSIRKQIKQLLD